MTRLVMTLAGMIAARIIVRIGVGAGDIAAERRTRAATQRRADQTTSATAHCVAGRRTCAAAQRTADDRARALAAVRRDRAACAATDRTANHRARATAHRATQRGP